MTDPKEKTDAELVALTLKDQDNFEFLVGRYEQKFFHYIKRFMGFNKETIEDILQEVFIKIYINLNDYDADFSFSSWAYRIVHNETINYLRKNQKIKTVPLETEDEETNDWINTLSSEINIAEDQSKQDMNERIKKAIQMLPKKYREILLLRYVEDLDYKEISDVLKIPMGTVATQVNRAKEKFKEIAKKNHLSPVTS